MKIAVVGAGIFGCTAAIKLARAGHKVELFDMYDAILRCASGINQYRLHRGYHYPRSVDTAIESSGSVDLFEDEYRPSIINTNQHYYAISREGSNISAVEYVQFLDRCKLPYSVERIDSLPILKPYSVAALFKVQENNFDVAELYLNVMTKLRNERVDLRFNEVFWKPRIPEYDLTINATYANTNDLLADEERVDYQFELCEKPVVSVSPKFQNTSVVVLDGNFGCIDPYGNTKFHVVGHVDHAVIDRRIDKFYSWCRGFPINSGVVKSSASKHKSIFDGLCQHFNFNDWLTWQGSMFTVRTVLPNQEHDDARPSYITKNSKNVWSIFSGKIGTAVKIADDLVKMI